MYCKRPLATHQSVAAIVLPSLMYSIIGGGGPSALGGGVTAGPEGGGLKRTSGATESGGAALGANSGAYEPSPKHGPTVQNTPGVFAESQAGQSPNPSGIPPNCETEPARPNSPGNAGPKKNGATKTGARKVAATGTRGSMSRGVWTTPANRTG